MPYVLYAPSDQTVLYMKLLTGMSELVGNTVCMSVQDDVLYVTRKYQFDWTVLRKDLDPIRYFFIHEMNGEELEFLATRGDAWLKLIFIPELEDEFLDFLKRENYVI